MYYNVVVENRSRMTDRFYTYSYGEDLKIGTVVEVSFGKGTNDKLGVVVGASEDKYVGLEEIKEISSIHQEFALSKEAVDTALWMKSRYGIRYIDGLKLFFPQGSKAKKKSVKDFLDNISPVGMGIRSLTKDQEHAWDQMKESMEAGNGDTFLIKGVTGSGKTELYFLAMEQALQNGKTALYLVPEITHIGQALSRIVSRFGRDIVAVLHSRLTPAQRFYQWEKIYSGKAKIVVSSRSGVFAPVENLGVVIMDEEHEGAYKSDMNPKYETLDVAFKRANYYKANLILGSATPSIVSYYRAKKGIYKLVTLDERYNKVPLPHMEIVDMTKEMRQGNLGMISGKLYQEMRKTLEAGKQVILFINRKGYANFVETNENGNPRQVSFGTEKVEETCEKLFSEYSTVRLDLDVAKSAEMGEQILKEFELGLHEILVGTQIIAKSIDYKNVGLVGIVLADITLKNGDYRGGENTFQLITQVAGRAGRGDEQGKVVVQTMNPDNLAILCAVKEDYETFYSKEIEVRKFLNYPPFTDMVEVAVTSRNIGLSKRKINEYLNYICGINELKELVILSPREDKSFRGEDKSRMSLVIKCPKKARSALIKASEYYSKELARQRCGSSLLIDVNPY